ncbi:MAG TPA: carboxypeptidase regulatory-like domain-containing protein, partial [Nitrospirales bacterium]|nr:carboxypeptidase regulatory-like domain-containing protein [Nitrospirales bacterium]
MMMRVLVVVIFLMMVSSMGWAYQESQVSNGGAIQGHVRLLGEPPRPMAFNLVTIPDAVYCG